MTISLEERRERLWIRRLQSLNCFDQLLRRLVRGESPMAVAKWAVSLDVEVNWSLQTWRRYLWVLSQRVKRGLPRIKRAPPSQDQARVIAEELKVVYPQEEVDPLSEKAKPVWDKVQKAADKVDAATALRYAFMVQLGRVQRLLEIEEKLGMLMPTGYRDIAELREIGAELRKIEIGEQWLRGKDGLAASMVGSCPGGQMPHETVPEQPSDLEHKIGRLSDVDRNLMRSAALRVVEMIQEEALGKSSAEGLADDSARAGGGETARQ